MNSKDRLHVSSESGSKPGSRRRRALGWAVVWVVSLGLVLDLLLGSKILIFSPRDSGLYWGPHIPAVGPDVPIEEALFYALGPAAILMVYAWLDEHWMNAYNTRESRQAMPPTKRLFELSPMIAIIGIALLFMGSVVHHALDNSGGWFALYFSFLVCGAFLPAAVMFRSVKNLVNWRAFSFTLLYVVATSVIWEVTLAVPRLWWGYRPEGMLHLYVPAWTPDVRRGIPVEAVMVWFAAPFVSVLTYEAVKLYLYIPNASIRERLWGRNN